MKGTANIAQICVHPNLHTPKSAYRIPKDKPTGYSGSWFRHGTEVKAIFLGYLWYLGSSCHAYITLLLAANERSLPPAQTQPNSQRVREANFGLLVQMGKGVYHSSLGR